MARPNVLLVTVDQWPGRLLGCAGHPSIQTPTLDALARMGVRFPRAYSETPVCIPARRTLMTGTLPRTHGDRTFKTTEPMPRLPTMAQTFRDAGYQAFAVGKLHVYPQRDRIGFDDVILSEEGRPHIGAVDDYDIFLADQGYPGQQHAHGMSNNDYLHRPWHLPEACHVTNWATREMVRLIKRRDPTRPAFWYLSYTPPHPPLVPLAGYLDLYRQLAAEPALAADWSAVPERLPHALRLVRDFYPALTPAALAEARRAFMALCTHIDHQLRLVWGTLREEGLLDDTVVCVTADHGDMLGDFGLYAKRLFYEGSAQVPMLLVGTAGDRRVTAGAVDDRLVGLVDVMPTLLELAGVPAPAGLEGRSMVTGERRATLYGEIGETASATRMLHDGRYKLIWYPAGNRLQLLDLALDPRELVDLAGHPAYAAVRRGLEDRLAAELYGVDVEAGWTRDGRLSGFDPGPFAPRVDRSLTGQRGLHYPQPPQLAADRMVGFPG